MRVAIGLVVALAAGGTFGARYVADARTFVSTENAQVDGDRIVITAPATGTLVGWRADQGTELREDTPVGRIRMDAGSARPQMVIRSPGDGVVGVDSATDGAYVTAGTELATVYGREGLYVTARIEEGEIRHVAPGSSAEVIVDAFPGTALAGSVTQIQGGTAGTFAEFVPADTTGDAVKVGQLVAVRIALPPTEFDLVPGMNVSVRIRRAEPPAGGSG